MTADIRPASAADVGDLVPLLRDLYRGEIGPGFVDILSEYLASEAHHVVVATDAGHIVGVAIGSYRLDIDYECRAALIDAIVVHRSYRRQGIGTRLVRAIADWAQARGCTVLQVINGRPEFFEKLGLSERRLAFLQGWPPESAAD